MKNKQAFTLVELIVVVTILAILSTIGFVSYSGYLAGVRDTNRIAQLKAIGDALHLYSTNKSLPTPDNKVDIQIGTGVNEKTISYQGYAGKDVIETIGYTAEGMDPKDKSYYSYYITKDKKYFQLMAFLEEEQELALKFKVNNKVQAEIDYETRYPRLEGDKLGILTGTGNVPLQELVSGSLNLETTNDIYKLNIDNLNSLSGTGSKIIGLQGAIKSGGALSSCKKILDKRPGLKGKDGYYLINPSGDEGMTVYCDMTSDGGGWTMVFGDNAVMNTLEYSGYNGYSDYTANQNVIEMNSNIDCSDTRRLGITVDGITGLVHTQTKFENINWQGSGNGNGDDCFATSSDSRDKIIYKTTSYTTLNEVFDSKIDSDLSFGCGCDAPNDQRGGVTSGNIYIR